MLKAFYYFVFNLIIISFDERTYIIQNIIKGEAI